MPATVDAADVALRLSLTVLAGLLIGYNRREHGKGGRPPHHGAGLSGGVLGDDPDQHPAPDGWQGQRLVHHALGLAGLVLGFLTLWGLELIEERLERDHRADLTIETDVDGPSEESIQRRLARVGLRASSCHVTLAGNRRELAFVVSGRRHDTDVRAPEFLADFARQPGVLRLEWKALA